MVQCYDWHPDIGSAQPLSSVWVQCPSTLGCCVRGSQCLGYNLCKAPSSSSNDNTNNSFSGYYIQRCSDPLYSDPACAKLCNAPGPPDVVYNSTSQLWTCCGNNANGDVSCNAPTDEVFQAPPVAALSVLSSGVPVASTETLTPGSTRLSSSTTTTTTSSSSSASGVSSVPSAAATTSSNPSTTPTALATSQGSNGLSTGAKAGVGVGVALGVLAIVAIAVLLIFRRKKQRTPHELEDDSVGNGQIYLPADQKHTPVGSTDPVHPLVEKSADETPQELSSVDDSGSQGWPNGSTNGSTYKQSRMHELDAR